MFHRLTLLLAHVRELVPMHIYYNVDIIHIVVGNIITIEWNSPPIAIFLQPLYCARAHTVLRNIHHSMVLIIIFFNTFASNRLIWFRDLLNKIMIAQICVCKVSIWVFRLVAYFSCMNVSVGEHSFASFLPTRNVRVVRKQNKTIWNAPKNNTHTFRSISTSGNSIRTQT